MNLVNNIVAGKPISKNKKFQDAMEIITTILIVSLLFAFMAYLFIGSFYSASRANVITQSLISDCGISDPKSLSSARSGEKLFLKDGTITKTDVSGVKTIIELSLKDSTATIEDVKSGKEICKIDANPPFAFSSVVNLPNGN